MRSETCSVCGQEVRWGTRDGRTMYLHREDVDHLPILGNNAPVTLVPMAEVEEKVMPPVEVTAHDVDIADLPPRSGIRQVANLVVKTDGWEIVNLQHARGPYVGSKGDALSVSDSHVLRARARQVDGTVKIAVISWRDFKFDFAYIGTKNGVRKADSTTMKNWIKGTE